jgi:hypothetical protein
VNGLLEAFEVAVSRERRRHGDALYKLLGIRHPCCPSLPPPSPHPPCRNRTQGRTPPTQITRLYPPPQRPSSSLNPSHPFTRLSHCKARPSGVHNIPPAPARSVTGSGSYVNVPPVAPDPPWGVWDTTRSSRSRGGMVSGVTILCANGAHVCLFRFTSPSSLVYRLAILLKHARPRRASSPDKVASARFSQ